MRTEHLNGRPAAGRRGGAPRRLGPLIAVTVLNYAWQLPYGLHQYGWGWTAFPRLTIFLILTLIWFLVGVRLYRRSQGRRKAVLGSFLLVEVLFYAVHDVSGAFLSDLYWDNLIVSIESLLGYLTTVVALWYLLRLVSPVQPSRPGR